jgi:hypothetical protein
MKPDSTTGADKINAVWAMTNVDMHSLQHVQCSPLQNMAYSDIVARVNVDNQ